MKNLYKFIALVLFSSVFVACEEDLIIYDVDNGQTALSFASENITVGICNPTQDIVLESTTRSTTDRTYNISVNAASTADVSEYTLASSTITIPAGEFVGSTSVTVDFTMVPDGASRSLILDFTPTDGAITQARSQTSVNYQSVCTDNEVTVTVVTDAYPGETTVNLFDSNGMLVGGGGNTSFTVCIPAGTYTVQVLDSFGDGMCCAYGNGSVTAQLNDCSGSTELYANPISSFGAMDTRTFTLN